MSSGLEYGDGVLGDGATMEQMSTLLHAELAHAERLAGDGVEHAVGALDLAGEKRWAWSRATRRRLR
jgi:hypothetical protein